MNGHLAVVFNLRHDHLEQISGSVSEPEVMPMPSAAVAGAVAPLARRTITAMVIRDIQCRTPPVHGLTWVVCPPPPRRVLLPVGSTATNRNTKQSKCRPLFSRRFLEVHRVNQVMRQRRHVAIGCELMDVCLMATLVVRRVWSLRRLNHGLWRNV